jgi:hypothetical protein
MQTGTTFSGIGHAGLILWVLVGDWFFAPDPAPVVTTSFSVISEEEYDAMKAAATVVASEVSASVRPQARPASEPVVEPEPEPAAEPEPEPEPEPLPEPEPEPIPDPEPVVEPPPSDVPQAEVEQPLESQSPDIQPIAEAEDIVAPDPVEVEPEAETSEEPTPAVSDQPAEQPAVEETPTVESVPDDTAPTIATEETEAQDEETGMTTSIRPKSRPETPAAEPEPVEVAAATPDEPVEEPTEDPAEQPVDDAETTAAVDALLGEALEEPVEEPAAEPAGANAEVGEQNLPQGPPMSGSEKDAVRSAISRCWSTGSLSTAATRVKIVVRVQMSPDGKPLSVELADFSDGDEAAANNAFQPVRRAVMRSVDGCKGGAGLTLDPAKYAEWSVITLLVDGSGVLLQ